MAYEPVVVLLLKSSAGYDGSSFCDSTAYYSPMPLYFTGNYNDYGGVEDCEGVALDTLINVIRDNLYEMTQGDNQYHDIPAQKHSFDVDQLFELDHEGRLFLEHMPRYGDNREMVALSHIVIRKEVFDGLINGMEFTSWRDCGTYGFKELKAELPTLMEDMQKIVDEEDNMMRSIMQMSSELGDTKIASFLGYRNEYEINAPIKIMELLFQLYEAKDPNFEAMVDNALGVYLMHRFMEETRRSWCIPSGRGSQNNETKFHELISEITIKSAHAINTRWEDEDE